MSFVLFLVSVLLVGGGIAVGIWALVRGGASPDARATLDERLARGEISVEEHRERRDALGPRGPGRLSGILAVGLVLVGSIGVVASAAGFTGPRGGGMGGMMDGMPGMMDGGMGGMMGGRTERNAPPPEADAEQAAVTGGEFFFRPDEVRIRGGDATNLAFRNDGDMFHTLTVEELGIDLRAAPDESVSGGLGDVEPGRYTFICTVPGHAEAGMRGVLVVEEGS